MTLSNLLILIFNCITLVNVIILNVLMILNYKRNRRADDIDTPKDDEDLND